MGTCCSTSAIREGSQIITVSPKGGDFPTLSQAVLNSHPGDTIIINPGSYVEDDTIVLNRPLTIVGRSNLAPTTLGIASGVTPTGSALGSTQAVNSASFASSSDRVSVRSGHGAAMPLPQVKIHISRSRLFNVELASSIDRVVIRGIQIVMNVEPAEFPLVAVSRGQLVMEECDFSGGQDGIVVQGTGASLTMRSCSLHNASHACISFNNSCRANIDDCKLHSAQTGVMVCNNASPNMTSCVIAGCGTGLLVKDSGQGVFYRCTIERNTKPGIIVATKGCPVLRQCTVRDGESNGIFVRDEGRGVFMECSIYGNGLPGVATCSESAPILTECTIRDGRNAGVLVYDNGRGVVSDCIIHDNHMPGLEVRAGGNPVVSGCEIFNGESNGVYVHNRGRGTFVGCRVYENVLPGIAIRTSGHPLVYGCAVTTGKDNALMVCDKGRGVIVECALHGYSARPLEIRDGCTPIMHNCETHDGKHKHVVEWLQQVPHQLTKDDIRSLCWDDDQLAKEDVDEPPSAQAAADLEALAGDRGETLVGQDLDPSEDGPGSEIGNQSLTRSSSVASSPEEVTEMFRRKTQPST